MTEEVLTYEEILALLSEQARAGVQRRLPTSTERLPAPDFVGYNRRFRRRSPLVGGSERGEWFLGSLRPAPWGFAPAGPLLSLSPAP